MGRQHRASKRKEDEYEAYRLLGQSVSFFEQLTMGFHWHHFPFMHISSNGRSRLIILTSSLPFT